MKSLSVVIVNYNVRFFLEQCLESVYSSHTTASSGDFRIDVTVVDNNSVDDSLTMLSQRFPQVKVVANKENVGFAKAHNYKAVQEDIEAVVKAAHDAERTQGYKALVKVIIETCYLTDEEKVAVCKAAKKAGADFVKTSTGFGTPGKNADGSAIPNGATVHDVALMRKTVDEAEPAGVHVFVKASGGIRDTKTALDMVAAGADRLGVSAGIAIVTGFEQ